MPSRAWCNLNQYLQSLKLLGKDCNFLAVSAKQNYNECICDAFVNGFQSPHIRERLLEDPKLKLSSAYKKVRALEAAQKQSEAYSHSPLVFKSRCRSSSSHITAKRAVRDGWQGREHDHCCSREEVLLLWWTGPSTSQVPGQERDLPELQ